MTPQTEAGRALGEEIVLILDGEWGVGNPDEMALLRAEWGAKLCRIEAQSYARALADVRREVGTMALPWASPLARIDILAILDRLAEPQP